MGHGVRADDERLGGSGTSRTPQPGLLSKLADTASTREAHDFSSVGWPVTVDASRYRDTRPRLVGFLGIHLSDSLWSMSKVKVSATVDPAHLERAKELTGVTSVSEVLERGLVALIEDELERIHADGYVRAPQDGETVSAVDAAVWADLPWDEE